MNLADWRQSRIEEMTLPSGLDVTVKHVGLTDLLVGGNLPAPLLDQISELVEHDASIQVSNFSNYAESINAVVKACMVYPPVADEPDDTHIALSELPFEDRVHIFEWANGEAVKLSSFREEPAGSVDAALDVIDVQQSPEQHPGDPG